MTGHVRTGRSTSQPCVVRHILLLSNATLPYGDRTVNQVEISAIQCDRGVCIKLDKEGVMHALSYYRNKEEDKHRGRFHDSVNTQYVPVQERPNFSQTHEQGYSRPHKDESWFP